MSRRRNNSTQSNTTQPQARAIDPCGRVDIALCRLLETAVSQYAGVDVRAIYNVLAPQINMGIQAVVGPRTTVGVTAKQAVNAIHAVAAQIHKGGRQGAA